MKTNTMISFILGFLIAGLFTLYIDLKYYDEFIDIQQKLRQESVLLKAQNNKYFNAYTDLKYDYEKLNRQYNKLRNERDIPGIHQKHLKSIINAVLVYLEEKDIKPWERLLCITILAESNMGQYTKQMNNGPAKGITQVELNTEKQTLKWLHKTNKHTYKKICKLRVPAKLIIHEAEYNLAYSIALAYNVYRMKKVNPTNDDDTKTLVQLYKKYYNTYKGKATVEGVIEKINTYNINLD